MAKGLALPTAGHEVTGWNLGWRQNSAQGFMAPHCTEPFISTFPLSLDNLNNVERDVKSNVIIIIIFAKFSQACADVQAGLGLLNSCVQKLGILFFS